MKINYKQFLSYFLIFFLVTSLITCKNRFGLDINSYIYHINEPLDGLFLIFTWVFFKSAFIPSVLLALLFSYLPNINKIEKYTKYTTKFLLSVLVCFLFFFTYKIFKMPVNRALFLKNTNDFYAENYVNPDDVKINFKNKKNILILSMESMERGYDNLIPNLIKYENTNLSFKNYYNITSANFTMGSNVAIMCGVGLLSYNKSSTGSLHRKFMPNITCISDILAKNGYKNYHLQAGSPKFSGVDKFVKEHNYEYIIGNLGDGIEGDKILYSKAKNLLQEIKDEPYLIWLSTMATHDPMPDTNVIKESDEIAFEFIEWYKKFDKDAIIVIVGDHLARGSENELKSKLQKLPTTDRSTINLIVKGGGTDYVNKNRVFTYFDLMPTILESIGGQIEGRKLGLGVSLYGNDPTLAEKYGAEKFEEQVAIGGSEKYKSFFKNKE
ncbi:MAG: LTA synthase family protein [Rickettsiales bacterium]|nr:MAG: LTA synthase family protein [Rickettsiales bacterium]